MDIEDIRTAQDLREAFARIANTENREELSSPKVKYNSKQQYIKINQVLNNAEIRGNWEYDLKKFVDSCDRDTQSKLVCGNYIDIRTLKRNMTKSLGTNTLDTTEKKVVFLRPIINSKSETNKLSVVNHGGATLIMSFLRREVD